MYEQIKVRIIIYTVTICSSVGVVYSKNVELTYKWWIDQYYEIYMYIIPVNSTADVITVRLT